MQTIRYVRWVFWAMLGIAFIIALNSQNKSDMQAFSVAMWIGITGFFGLVITKIIIHAKRASGKN